MSKQFSLLTKCDCKYSSVRWGMPVSLFLSLTSSSSKSSPTTSLIPSAVRNPFPSRSRPSNTCRNQPQPAPRRQQSHQKARYTRGDLCAYSTRHLRLTCSAHRVANAGTPAAKRTKQNKKGPTKKAQVFFVSHTPCGASPRPCSRASTSLRR